MFIHTFIYQLSYEELYKIDFFGQKDEIFPRAFFLDSKHNHMSSLWMYVELYGLSILVRIIFPPEWRKFFVAKKRLMMTFKGRSGKIQTGKSFVVTDSRKMIREIEINSLCLLYFWFHGKNVYLVHFSPFHSWFFFVADQTSAQGWFLIKDVINVNNNSIGHCWIPTSFREEWLFSSF